MLLQATRFDAVGIEPLFAEHAFALRISDAVAALGRRLALACRLAPLGLNATVRSIGEHVANHPRVAEKPGSVPRDHVAAIPRAAA